jgi:hypothetical protein
MHDAADDAAVVRPLDAPYIRRQMRFDSSPLFVAQPKQVPAHNPDPLPTTNQDRIVRAKKLMSSDPSKQYSKNCQSNNQCDSDNIILRRKGKPIHHQLSQFSQHLSGGAR